VSIIMRRGSYEMATSRKWLAGAGARLRGADSAGEWRKQSRQVAPRRASAMQSLAGDGGVRFRCLLRRLDWKGQKHAEENLEIRRRIMRRYEREAIASVVCRVGSPSSWLRQHSVELERTGCSNKTW
jgi:hypothetical protein